MYYVHRMKLPNGSQEHVCGGDCRLPNGATEVRLEGPFSEEEALLRFRQSVTFAMFKRTAEAIARGEVPLPSRLIPVEPPDPCGERFLDSL